MSCFEEHKPFFFRNYIDKLEVIICISSMIFSRGRLAKLFVFTISFILVFIKAMQTVFKSAVNKSNLHCKITYSLVPALAKTHMTIEIISSLPSILQVMSQNILIFMIQKKCSNIYIHVYMFFI